MACEVHRPKAAFAERYRPVAELGKGGFGTVYLVRRHADGKEFAAKTILRSRCKNWQQATTEVDHWSTLSAPYHPAILQLLEAVHVEGASLHLVTEVMSHGEELGAAMQERRKAPPYAREGVRDQQQQQLSVIINN